MEPFGPAASALSGEAQSSFMADRIHESVKPYRIFQQLVLGQAPHSRRHGIEKKTGKVFFDSRLAEDQEHFELVKDGWKKDHCFLCRSE
jgi:hypothetical protein